MYVFVRHYVSKPQEFLDRAGGFRRHPGDLHLSQFVPAKDKKAAFSLWVAPSMDAVRRVVEAEVGKASVQEYHEVDEKHSEGLEKVEANGAKTAAT